MNKHRTTITLAIVAVFLLSLSPALASTTLYEQVYGPGGKPVRHCHSAFVYGS